MNEKDLWEMYDGIASRLEKGFMKTDDIICVYIIDVLSIATVSETIKKIDEKLSSSAN